MELTFDENQPPILKDLKGLRVSGVGHTDDGYPFIRLAADEQSTIRNIVVYVVGNRPSRFHYAYTYVDPTTKVLVSKRGEYGDPEKDTDGEWVGLG